MATWSISADAAETIPGVVTGTILQGGTVAGDKFTSRDNADVTAARTSHGSMLPDFTASTSLDKSDDAGTVNAVVANKYIGPFITGGLLAGIAKTVVDTPASDYGRRTLHRQVTTRRINITNWNYLTGAATFGGDRGAVYTQYAQSGTVDDASNPTLGVPGELVYRNGSPTPVEADYPTKTQVK